MTLATKPQRRFVSDLREGVGNVSSNASGIGNDPSLAQKGVLLSALIPFPLTGKLCAQLLICQLLFTCYWFQGNPARVKTARPTRHQDDLQSNAAATPTHHGGFRATLVTSRAMDLI